MVKTKVRFDTVVQAKEFVGICNEMDFKVELVSDPYIIDAKSIMGLFSLDLSKPVELMAHSKDDGADFLQKISKFVVEE